MAKKTLTTSYLVKLSNANHDGVTQQIDDRFAGFETENMMLVQAAAEVHTARQAEDVAFKRFSGKDFASDDLKKEDRLEDQYMSTIRAILNGLTLLPDTEPMRRKAEVAVQVFKDFQFSTNDGFEAEARKTLNMVQEWTVGEKYDLAGLGISEWVTKANQQAAKVLALIQQRVDTESAKVKGELADARKVTDAAIRKAFDIVNTMAVLQPSDGLTQLMQTLFGIEERAKLYYISSGKSTSDGGGSEDGGEDGKDDGGVTPVQPE